MRQGESLQRQQGPHAPAVLKSHTVPKFFELPLQYQPTFCSLLQACRGGSAPTPLRRQRNPLLNFPSNPPAVPTDLLGPACRRVPRARGSMQSWRPGCARRPWTSVRSRS